jgi:LytS/YehU family sensor histidine kinase
MFVYTIIASLIIIYIFVTFWYGYDFWKLLQAGRLNQSLMIPLFITVIFALWGHGQAFLIEWRQAAIDVERLKTENLKSKFESLKSQVNPHFLFNSLNALTNLVYADQDRAAEFIQKLSEVYRYVLDHQNDEVVSLKEEMDFLKSYVYLNQIRFGKNLSVTYENLDGWNEEWMVPPVALQMLMENALKHNEISTDFPLHVRVCLADNRLLISNNINPITHPKRDSSGLGLSNIKERFAMMTDEQVVVEKSADQFSVQIPLLTVQS